MKRISWVLADALLLLALVWTGVRFFAPLEQVVAIELWDETAYMLRGLRLPWYDLLPTYGALYSLFYRLLAGLEPEPLRLYYLAYRAAAVLLPVAVYWALRRADVIPPVAAAAAWVTLVSRGTSIVWPRVPVFALVWLLAGWGWVWGREWRSRPAALRWALAAAWLWSAAYIRPEYAGAALLTGMGALGLAWRQRRRAVQGSPLAWGSLAVLIVLPTALWGWPFQGPRSWDAFAQHFTVRRADQGEPIPDPWRSSIRPTIDRYFGPQVYSVWDAVRANPRAVAQHVQANLSDLPTTPRLQGLLDLPLPGLWGSEKHLLKLGLLMSMVVWIARLRKGHARARVRFLLESPVPWLMLAAAPPLASILFIYPHRHYAWPAAMTGLVLLTLLAAPTTDDGPRAARWWSWWNLAMSAVLAWALVIYTPNDGIQRWIPRMKPNPVPGLAAFVRGLPWESPVPMLGADGGLDLYLGPRIVSLDEQLHGPSLLSFLQQRRVRLLLFPGGEPEAAYFCRYYQDECRALLAAPQAYGFRPRWLSLAEGTFLFLVAEE